MFETEVAVVTLALGIAISDYSIYYLIFEKSFVERFRKFKEALNIQFRKTAEDFLKDFKRELEQEFDPADLIDFADKWAKKQSVVLDIVKSWSDISSRHRWIIGFCALSILSTGLYFLHPDPLIPGAEKPLNLLNIAALFLFCEIYHILSFLFEFSKLSTKVSKFELGEPLEKVFEEEVEEILKEKE